MISLTEKAIQKIIEISEAEGLDHKTVRVKVVGGGCAGFTHDMTFDNTVGDMDEVLDLDGGVKIVCDPLSSQYLEGTTIDYEDSLFGGGFKFVNPNTTGTCGCGKSVSY